MVLGRIRARFRALFACVIAVVGMCGASGNAQKPTTLRSSSSLVLVPVSALDKSGNFVSGLSAGDFQIPL